MPEARAMTLAIFLDEVNQFNAPLMFIPGSHQVGVIESENDTSTTSYPLWTINHATIASLVARGFKGCTLYRHAAEVIGH